MTDCDEVRNAILAGLPQVLLCEPDGKAGLRLRTAFEHADGDLVDIYLLERAGRVVLTDHGESLRHLEVLGFDPTNTPKKRALMQEALANLNIAQINGSLEVGVDLTNFSDFMTKFMRFSQAITRVGDLVFMAREHTPRFFRDDVGEFLRERQIEFEEDPLVTGRTGQSYRLDFRIPRQRTPLLVKTLTTGSRAAAETVVNATVRAFLDLSKSTSNEDRVAVFDDEEDVWTDAQFDILHGLGRVIMWSAANDLERLAKAI